MVSMKSVPAKELPVKKLSALLHEYGISDCWKHLLYTYIVNNHTMIKHQVLVHEFFENSLHLDTDLLKGLSIGNIGVLYEYSLAYSDTDSRKESGQYFTPDDVAQLMSRLSLKFSYHDSLPDKPNSWLDPCSGVGNLSLHLIEEQSNHRNFSREELLKNFIVMDRDALALFIARVLLVSHCQGVAYNGNLFAETEHNFIVHDFLDMDKDLPCYDYAILNPPYLRTIEDTRFETAKATDLYAYFIERIIKTAEKGYISITPQSFTNAQKFLSLRKVMNNHASSVDIYCFDNVPDSIFKGVKYGSTNSNKANSTRAAITVFEKTDSTQIGEPGEILFEDLLKDDDSTAKFRITPLLRWRTEERARMFREVNNFLTPMISVSSKLYPKVSHELYPLYQDIVNMESLRSIISHSQSQYKLNIPSSPRYFTPAIKRDISRASAKILYFKNKSDYDYAYLLLNSSLLYWWWRVNDGGMTLASSTLLSLPLVDFNVSNELVKALESSEERNLVVKENAGKSNENIKHSFELIHEINKIVSPQYADDLLNVHNNSVLM